MCAAAAFEIGESVADLLIARVFIVAQERCRGHHPAIDAVAALRHLLIDIGGLDRVGFFRRPKSRERGDLRSINA